MLHGIQIVTIGGFHEDSYTPQRPCLERSKSIKQYIFRKEDGLVGGRDEDAERYDVRELHRKSSWQRPFAVPQVYTKTADRGSLGTRELAEMEPVVIVRVQVDDEGVDFKGKSAASW